MAEENSEFFDESTLLPHEMVPKYGIRALESKYAVNKLEIIALADHINVLAASNPRGELMLYRLNWTKVWMRKPPLENLTIVGISWRPDNQVLAVAYSNWEVHLINVEKQIFIDKLVQGDEIYMLTWLREEVSVERVTEYMDLMEGTEARYRGAAFPMNSDEEVVHKIKIAYDQSNISFLAIGRKNSIYFYTFGFLNTGKIELSQYVNCQDVVPIDAYITKNMRYLGVVCNVVDTHEAIFLQFGMHEVFGIPQTHYTMAMKRAGILGDMMNISRCIEGIMENWEDIYLNELLIPFRKYAKDKEPGTLVTELLELLLVGCSSQSLHSFLMNDLSERKLKKTGASIEACYVSVQKIILENLRPGLEILIHDLSMLKGTDACSRFSDQTYRSYINKNILSESMIQCNVAHMKCSEMLSIMDNNSTGIRPAFFQWLAYNISKLCDNNTTTPKPRLSGENVQNIANYIRSLESNDSRSSDPLSPYLMKDLPMDVPAVQNEWCKFLNEHPNLSSHLSFMHPECQMDSLLTVHERINGMLKELFTGMDCVMNNVKFQFSRKLGNVAKVSFTECSEMGNIMVACLVLQKDSIDVPSLFVSDFGKTEAEEYSKFTFGTEETVLKDVQFYSDQTVCVLVDYKRWDQMYMIQIPINVALRDENLYNFRQLLFWDYSKAVPGMKPNKFFLNFNTKVCVMTAPPGNQLRIYEMEVDENAFNLDGYEEGDYSGENGKMDTSGTAEDEGFNHGNDDGSDKLEKEHLAGMAEDEGSNIGNYDGSDELENERLAEMAEDGSNRGNYSGSDELEAERLAEIESDESNDCVDCNRFLRLVDGTVGLDGLRKMIEDVMNSRQDYEMTDI